MLEFTPIWYDLAKLAPGDEPVVMLERPLLHGDDPRSGTFAAAEVARTGTYWVPQLPVVGRPPEVRPDWKMTRTGPVVRVPLHWYTVPRALSYIWGLGVQVGLAAAAELRGFEARPPRRAVLVLGTDCVDMTPLAGKAEFRCLVGLALVVDDN